jgi:hypothetical protein
MKRMNMMQTSQLIEFTRRTNEEMGWQEPMNPFARRRFYRIHDQLELKLGRMNEIAFHVNEMKDLEAKQHIKDKESWEKKKQDLRNEYREIRDMTIEEPKNWKEQANVLGALAYTFRLQPEDVLQTWGVKALPKAINAAYDRVKWELAVAARALEEAQDAGLGTLEWTLNGLYSPSNARREAHMPDGLTQRTAPRYFGRRVKESERLQDRMAKNWVYRSALRGEGNMRVDYEQALDYISSLKYGNTAFTHPGIVARTKMQGNVDYHKLMDINIGTERDPGVLIRNWLIPVIERVNYAREFEPDGLRAKSYIQYAAEEGWKKADLIRLHDDVAGATPMLTKGRMDPIIRELTGVFGGIKHLGMAGLSQLSSAAYTKTKVPWNQYMRALVYDPKSKTPLPALRATIAASGVWPVWFRETFGDMKYRKFAAEVGQLAQAESVLAMAHLQGITPKASAFLQKNVYLISSFDRFGRYLGAISGRFVADEVLTNYQKMVRNGQGAAAREKYYGLLQETYGEDPEILELAASANYNAEQKLFLERLWGQIMATRASGRNLPGDMPLGYSDPTFAPIYKLSVFPWQLQKESYRIFDYNDPTSIVRNKDSLGVFIRWLDGMILTFGTAILLRWLRDQVNKDPKSIEDMTSAQEIVETASWMGTYPLLIDSALAVTGRWGPLIEQLGGPVYSGAAEAAQQATAAVGKGDEKAAGRVLVDVLYPKGWWNYFGIPTPQEVKDQYFPRKRGSSKPPKGSPG